MSRQRNSSYTQKHLKRMCKNVARKFVTMSTTSYISLILVFVLLATPLTTSSRSRDDTHHAQQRINRINKHNNNRHNTSKHKHHSSSHSNGGKNLRIFSVYKFLIHILRYQYIWNGIVLILILNLDSFSFSKDLIRWTWQ